jgi:deoxycytidylate deaminase
MSETNETNSTPAERSARGGAHPLPSDDWTFPDELIFAFVYAVGTQAEPIQKHLATQLAQFGYEIEDIKLSDLFQDHMGHCNGLALQEEPYFARISSRMDAGNRLREVTQHEDIAAQLAVAAIQQTRPDSVYNARPRTAYIVSSLKREEEVVLLRAIYGSAFFLIGVYAPEEERSLFLQMKHSVPEADARKLIERDKDERKVSCGQRTGETFALADVFITQDASVGKASLSRFVDLVFGCPFETPTQDEQGMFLAYSASLRSGDLSRQVGAALTTSRGDVLAVGCNDVPRYGGGLYWPGPGDQRDHVRGADSNEKRRDEIIRTLLGLLRNDSQLSNEACREFLRGLLGDPVANAATEGALAKLAERLSNNEDLSLADAKTVLRDTPLFSLTEFGRTVHAEMDALLAAARVGRTTVGSTLYATTFPCHNCTRHIVAAGLSRVVYVEPYPKSLAFRFHFDSIVLNERGLEGSHQGECRDKVVYEPFLGIGPRRYFDLFSLKLSSGREVARKEYRASGDVIAWSRLGQRPRVTMDTVSYLNREKVTAAKIDSLLPSM